MCSKSNKGSIQFLCDVLKENNYISPELYRKFDVKRGLRNADGTGVLAGLTNICNVHGYIVSDGEKKAVPGELIYRGINIKDIISGCSQEKRFGFEEVIWLLLFGSLPTSSQLETFSNMLFERRELPDNFAEDMILKAPSINIMNKLGRSVLALYSYDDEAENTLIDNVIRQSIELIAQMPTIMVDAYQVKKRHFDHKSMYFHPPIAGHSFAEHILSTLRDDRQFTQEEARLLDICMILHADHGGGNNSTFTC
ncbi:MAG: citrate/2-methylcitrate synthase, partial [Oscillospiraceae bacterium]